MSTPYWHACELLDDGRGCLVPFADPEPLAEQVNRLLDDDGERHAIRRRAYYHTRDMVWQQVAQHGQHVQVTRIITALVVAIALTRK